MAYIFSDTLITLILTWHNNISKLLFLHLTSYFIFKQVRGWARVAPMSCMLLTQKRYRKPKHKEADDPAPLSADPTFPNADGSASIKKPMQSNQHTGSWSNTAVATLQKEASEWPVLNAVSKTMSNLLLGENVEEKGTLRETPSQNRPTKSQKPSHRPNNTVVPKHLTFLPLIETPHLNPQRVSGQICSGKKAPKGETIEENCFMFDKKSGTKGIRVDPVVNQELPTYSAGLTSKFQMCQHNPHLLSVISVSIPNRYQGPMSSKRDTAHRTNFSMGKRALHSSTAAGAPARMRPNKTMCAVNLYDGCEINL